MEYLRGDDQKDRGRCRSIYSDSAAHRNDVSYLDDLSGAYFGDKLSPMSDTTVLASSIAGADPFSHHASTRMNMLNEATVRNS